MAGQSNEKPMRSPLRTVEQVSRRLLLSKDAVTQLCDLGELEAGDVSPQSPTDRCRHCPNQRSAAVHTDKAARGHHEFAKSRRQLRVSDDSVERFEERRMRARAIRDASKKR